MAPAGAPHRCSPSSSAADARVGEVLQAIEALAALSMAVPGALWGGTGLGETEAPGARRALVRASKKRARSCSGRLRVIHVGERGRQK